MMKHIVIIGGGFAGLWAALGTAHQVDENKADIKITLVSKDTYLNIRPRFYEKEPQALRTPLSPTLEPLGVQLIAGIVESVNEAGKTVDVLLPSGVIEKTRYDRLILATGSELKGLPVPGMVEYGWNIDTYDAAISLDQHMRSVLQQPVERGHNTFVVIGAGFTGIELVTEMRDRIAAHSDADTAEHSRIVLVEKGPDIGKELGLNPRPAVESAIRDANIEVKSGMCVDAVTSTTARLSNGEVIYTSTVINTAGLQASTPDETLPVERDNLGRLATDNHLRVRGLDSIYAAGDVARAYVDDEHLALMSCQHAMEMGKFAGYNAVRDLLELPLRAYRQPVYLTCIDLGRSRALYTSGWERAIQKSGDEAKKLKQQINTQWIYPPVGTRDQILATVSMDVEQEVSDD
ncbi:MAG: FAD-dependent oxidoreductase [gamma proteobacterium endosymbiont of Lamellibrachia anaximandri]|nr:FAD-dependent oxidoreductase [gamma proteobacterium endosymbiont of Lamellibrachia anaximandri]MBL3535503.1 FAD-dependent oxidoreductase [gamma proteobacterium endosymbiont of Lamellibrachia anaximandri]